jgi:hypothetical protein
MTRELCRRRGSLPGTTRGFLGKDLYLPDVYWVYWEKVFTWNVQRMMWKRPLPGMTRGFLGKGVYLECP